jgi:hypothetical protein
MTSSDHFCLQVLKSLYNWLLRGTTAKQVTVVKLPAFCGAEEGRVFALWKQFLQLPEAGMSKPSFGVWIARSVSAGFACASVGV